MTRLKTLSALLIAAAAAVAAPGLAFAQEHHDDRHDDHGPARHEEGHPGPGQHPEAHAPGPAHGWHKGDRVPQNYRGNQYVVNDWKARHLRQPPRGYHWVNVNGDFVLAAVATGVIADLLLNN